jgi:hypothetical protein
MKAEAMLDALGSLYPAAQGWVLLPQVPNATGAGTGRTADGLALNAWPSRGLQLDGFELKSYRGDWLRELKNPAKAEGGIYRYCDRWWIVIPDTGETRHIARPSELPPSWGLIVCSEGRAAIEVAATALKPKPLDRAFLASVLRRLAACEAPAGKIAKACEAAHQEGVAAGRREERARLEHRSQRQELRWQRQSLESLADSADRIHKAIKRELAGLKDYDAEEPDDPAPAAEAAPRG